MKITGPLSSISARGTLGKTLIFATKWRLNLVRAFHAPTGVATNNQLTQRASFKSIIIEWRTRTKAERQAWQDIAPERLPLSGYNIFLSLPISKRNVRIFGNAKFGNFYFGSPVPK